MPRVAFTAKTRKYLGSLDAVESVTQYRICYSKEFRDDCMRRYAEGGSPAAIFREAGLDPKIIGYKRVERCIARWKAEDAENPTYLKLVKIYQDTTAVQDGVLAASGGTGVLVKTPVADLLTSLKDTEDDIRANQ